MTREVPRRHRASLLLKQISLFRLIGVERERFCESRAQGGAEGENESGTLASPTHPHGPEKR